MQPVSQELNDASIEICTRIFPFGFDVTDDAPNSFDELSDALRHTGRMAIWAGDFSHTAFADTEAWREFRAWHDWVHYRYDLRFSLPDEHAVCHVQAAQLVRLYGRGENVAKMVAVLFCTILDTLEQPLSGNTPADWWEFARDNWERWLPYARKLVGEQGVTDVAALRYAANCYAIRAEVGPPVSAQAAPVQQAA